MVAARLVNLFVQVGSARGSAETVRGPRRLPTIRLSGPPRFGDNPIPSGDMEPKFMSPDFGFISLKSEPRIEGLMKKSLSTVLLGFLLVTTSFIIFAPAVRATTQYSVQVGYADDLRAAPNFPSPWCGSPNVALFASVGDSACAGSGPTWDDGAILITNTGTSSITCVNNIPTVEFTVNGVQSNFKDVGFTLDTGGFDSVNSNPCPDNGNPNSSNDQPGACNESLQWRDISSTCGVTCPGGNPTPTVPEFGFPIVLVAALGLLALVLVRKAVLPRRIVPPRTLT